MKPDFLKRREAQSRIASVGGLQLRRTAILEWVISPEPLFLGMNECPLSKLEPAWPLDHVLT